VTAIVAPSLSAARPEIAREAAAAPAPSPHALEERKRAHDERVARWQAIREAGGLDAWVGAQLKAKGVSTDGLDPAKLSDKEREAYKEKKRVEAAERRALRKLAWAAYKATHVVHLGPEAFWRDETKPDAFDVPRREERARQNQLDALATADDLAKALGVTLPALRWMTYHRDVDTGSHYRRWTIPKRDGSARTIAAPKRYLKEAQRWALRNVFDKFAVHGNAHGFLAGRSIVTNAEPHAGADLIVKVDIKDFFPSVSWRRVKGLLRKGGLPEGVATLLALLATEAPREAMVVRGRQHFVATGPRALPQGAPTSPAITNALCVRLDRRLSGLARTFGFRYTRYADDLTFSWRRPEGEPAAARAPVGALVRGVKAVLRAEGFAPHPSKTRVLRPGASQRVTGLVVNAAAGEGVAGARVPRETVRRLRAAIHNREKGRPGKPGESLAQLKGLAAFVMMTDRARGRAFLERLEALEAREGAPAPG
jgi:hypothetical protein